MKIYIEVKKGNIAYNLRKYFNIVPDNAKPIGTGSIADVYFEYKNLYVKIDDGYCRSNKWGYYTHIYTTPFPHENVEDGKVFEGYIRSAKAVRRIVTRLNRQTILKRNDPKRT